MAGHTQRLCSKKLYGKRLQRMRRQFGDSRAGIGGELPDKAEVFNKRIICIMLSRRCWRHLKKAQLLRSLQRLVERLIEPLHAVFAPQIAQSQTI